MIAGMKILIADDHPLFRDAFKGILHQLLENAEIKEMATFGELMSINSLQQFDFDMVFVDLAMPKGNPYESIAHLNRLNPKIPIIVVSGEESQEVVKNAIASGAIGFLPKSLDTDSLISNLKHVLSGAMAMVSPASVQDTDSRTLMSGLTARQTEVLELMCEGNTNKMIARALDLTEGTVKLHVRAILKTLGASNRTQAVAITKLHSNDVME
jgi:DNA-binding NarL/FixJ family response regulator